MKGESLEGGAYWASRHAKPARDAKEGIDPVSSEYPDLTVKGVEQARGRARGELRDLIKNAPEGAVIFISGTSDQPRTKQTAEIYGDELARVQAEDDSYVTVTKNDIEQMIIESMGEEKFKQAKAEKKFLPGQTRRVIEGLQQLIAENLEKKVVIDYPLMLKELAYKFKNRWTDKAGKKTEYFAEVLKKHNQNHAAAGEDWIKNQGRLEAGGKIIQGPLPEEVAEDYLHGLSRLQKFVQKLVPDRPVVVGEVGHQWDLDAVVTYLANQGKVDYEGYQKVSKGQGIFQESEMTEIVIDPEDPTKSVIKFRETEYPVGPSSEK